MKLDFLRISVLKKLILKKENKRKVISRVSCLYLKMSEFLNFSELNNERQIFCGGKG